MDEGANILRDLGNVEDKCNHSRHCDGIPIDKDCVAADSDETLLLHAKNRLKTLSLTLVGSRLADVSPDPRASDSRVGEILSLIRSLVGGEENKKVVRDPTKIATERWLEVRPSFGPMRAPPLSYAVAMLAESDADMLHVEASLQVLGNSLHAREVGDCFDVVLVFNFDVSSEIVERHLGACLDLGSVKVYKCAQPCGLKVALNTALRLACEHGFDIVELAFLGQDIVKFDAIGSFVETMDDANNSNIVLIDAASKSRCCTWAVLWRQIGFLEETLGERHQLGAVVQLDMSDHDVDAKYCLFDDAKGFQAVADASSDHRVLQPLRLDKDEQRRRWTEKRNNEGRTLLAWTRRLTADFIWCDVRQNAVFLQGEWLPPASARSIDAATIAHEWQVRKPPTLAIQYAQEAHRRLERLAKASPLQVRLAQAKSGGKFTAPAVVMDAAAVAPADLEGAVVSLPKGVKRQMRKDNLKRRLEAVDAAHGVGFAPGEAASSSSERPGKGKASRG